MLLLYVLLLLPTLVPLSLHWYTGAGPPFTGVAVNVTFVPAQIAVCDAEIVTVGETYWLMVIVITLLVAVGVGTQGALLVTISFTCAPFDNVDAVNVGLFVPIFVPFNCH